MQIFFLEEQLQEKPIQAGVEIPVDEAKVVASDVISVVGEFDALTFAATAALTLHPTAKDLSADKFQSLQLCKQFRTEQGGFIACVDHSSEPYDGKAVSLVGQGCRGRRIFRLFGQRLEDLQEHFIGFDDKLKKKSTLAPPYSKEFTPKESTIDFDITELQKLESIRGNLR